MVNLELNSNAQTLAENKVLILYILNKIGKPISHNELLDLVISTSDMNYFYFEQFLLDLLESDYVLKEHKGQDEILSLTQLGKEALELTINILPGILKLKVDSKFKASLDSIKDKNSAYAKYTQISPNNYVITFKIVENDETIFDMTIHSGSQAIAKKMVDNWNNNTEDIYPLILELLSK